MKIDINLRILKLGTAVALCFFSITLFSSNPDYGTYGMINSFSILYFISLFLFTGIAILAVGKSLLLSWTNVFLVIMTLWLFPYIIGLSTPMELHAYEMYGNVNHVLENGFIDRGDLLFLNWPSWALEAASLSLIFGADTAEWLIKLSPFIIQVLSVLGIILISRSKFGQEIQPRAWILIAVIFTITSWTHVSSFLPQGYAFALLFLFLGSISHLWYSDALLDFRYFIIIILFVFGIIVGHLLTSIAVIGFIAVLAYRSRSQFWRIFLFLSITLEAVWLIYWSQTFFQQDVAAYLTKLASSLGEIFKAFQEQAETAEAGGVYGQIAYMRILFSIAIFCLGIAGLVIWFRSRTREKIGWFICYIGIGMAVVLFTILGGSTSSYIVRLYSFEILPFVFFLMYSIRHKIGIIFISIIILVGLPFTLMIREGSQKWDYVGASYMNGLEFFHAHTSSGTVAEIKARSYQNRYAFGNYRTRLNYNAIANFDADTELISELINIATVPRPIYFVKTEVAASVFDHVLSQPETFNTAIDMVDEISRVQVYNSGYVVIWMY